MKFIAFLLFSSLAALFLPTAGSSAPGASLTLATVENLPPFSSIEEGKPFGIDIDIVQEVARRAEFTVTLEALPWARILGLLESGHLDGAFSAYHKDVREKFCLYTGVIHYDELRLATKRDSQFLFENIADLFGKRIGKGHNVFVSQEFDKAVEAGKITVEEVNDMDMSNISKLMAGRIDAVIGSPEALLHYAKKLGREKDLVLLPNPIKERIPAYLVLSKASPLADKEALGRKIREILEEMWRDGTVQAIMARHVPAQ